MVNCNLKECSLVEMEATTEKTEEGDVVLYTCPKCGNEVTVPVHKRPVQKRWFRRGKFN
ncbi:MAG: hypothetical protein ACXACX_15770 [Candidatus Hodarchaeales archaeon]|jgi:RNase P subunit RPR2